MIIKDFINWISYKSFLNEKPIYPKFKEGEVWWSSFGVNVGVETDGKNAKFNRPVLKVKKFNQRQFWAIPLSTKIKEENAFYTKVTLKNKTSYALLTQMRTLDSKRLQDRISKVSLFELENIREKIRKLLT